MADVEFERLGGHKYKERRTETHVYFVGGPFSNWWLEPFRVSPFPGYAEQTFNCNEQLMMASKALLFHDEAIYEAVMREQNPKLQKALGREVRNFDPVLWDLTAEELVFRGNFAKFTQSPRLLQYLLDTGDLHMVEGAFYDSVWGVKLAFDDPLIENEENWRGLNKLGKVHMRTRDAVRAI